MKTIFMYAGQGAQREGMGKDMYEAFSEYREVIDSLDLAFSVKKMMHEGALEELSRTENTQPCMAAFGAGVTAVLKANGILPDGVCGLSLGEYGALHAAGVMDASTYIKLVEFRGAAMARAAEGKQCSMSAVLAMEAEPVEEACREVEGFVVPVNFNCPGQYVICGDEEAVQAAETLLKQKGAKRCIRLNVGGPFHTKYMEPAAKELAEYLEKIEFKEPSVPLTLNVTGDFYSAAATEGKGLKDLLVRQIQSSVYFEKQLRHFLEEGADTFIEIGPGNTLTGFVKKTAKAMGKTITTITLDKAEDLITLIEDRKSC